MLHVSATQETGRSDRRMAAQGVRFPTVRASSPTDCACQDPWPDTLVASVRRLPSLGESCVVARHPTHLTSYIVPSCRAWSSSVS
jgi:hypothetical protein